MAAMMGAMVLEDPGEALQYRQLPVPSPRPGEVLIKTGACGVCRTDLHIVDGELTRPKLPLVPGHEVVGRVVACGRDVENLAPGQRVGVPWLGYTCGGCRYCTLGRENLCDTPQFTGYDRDGGYAQFLVTDHRYCFPMPQEGTDAQLAPLLCAGLIGYRAMRLAGSGRRVGLYGFGAAAHILVQLLRFQEKEVFAFTRPGDDAGQAFARSLGATWAGDSDMAAPEPLDAAIIFAPVGELVPAALRSVARGGVVVCAGIHMSDIPGFPYEILWGERVLRSVANLTRRDGEEFFPLAQAAGVTTEAQIFDLKDANTALNRLRDGRLQGAAVLIPEAC